MRIASFPQATARGRIKILPCTNEEHSSKESKESNSDKAGDKANDKVKPTITATAEVTAELPNSNNR